jgi:2-polyprenyl-6-hydroxyphenyl methylase / 3-demethylubiquinone-9 3-methyltransferase
MPVDNNLYDDAGDIWWSEDAPFSILRTMLNPARLRFFHKVLLHELGTNLNGWTAADVGCGGGLLSEELARLGLTVIGMDPSRRSIRTAHEHAVRSNLNVDYIIGNGESIPLGNASCDTVFCCDVIEHVDNPNVLIAEIARVLKPNGLFLYDTPNRTFISKLVVINVLQDWEITKCLPPNVHDWNKFIRPAELNEIMIQHNLETRGVTGMRPGAPVLSSIRSLRLRKRGKITHAELGRRLEVRESDDVSIAYMGWALKR